MNSKAMRRVLPVVFLSAMFCLLFGSNSFAGKTIDKIVNQSYAQGLAHCYATMNGNTGNDINGNYYKAIEMQMAQEIVEDNNFNYLSLFPNKGAKNKIYVPNGLTDEVNGSNDAASNCYNFTSGNADGWGGKSVYGRLGMEQSVYRIDVSSNRKTIDTFMEGMGYKSKAATVQGGATADASYCYSIKYRVLQKAPDGSWDDDHATSESTPANCVITNDKGQIVDSTDGKTLNGGHGGKHFLWYFSEGFNHTFQFWFTETDGDYGVCHAQSDPDCRDFTFNTASDSFSYDTVEEFEATLNKLVGKYNTLESCNNTQIPVDGSNAICVVLSGAEKVSGADDPSSGGGGGGTKTWSTGFLDGSSSASTAIDNMLSFVSKNSKTNKDIKAGSSYAKAGLTRSEKVVLYQYYVTNIANGEVVCDDVDNPEPEWTPIRWFVDAKTRKECYLKHYGTLDKSGNEMEYSLLAGNAAGPFYFKKRGKIGDVISFLQSMSDKPLEGIDETDLISDKQTQDQNHTVDYDPPEEAETYDCYSRAESLGWILCPIIDNLSNYIQNTYEQHITNFLVLDAGLFENGSTLQAWRSFQTMANVFFVIVFLAVILSQLTGFGIDNYGIKKILPKLVVSAILINLSYFICQIAIEVANIVGYGIGQIFESIGTQVSEIKISEAASVAPDAADAGGGGGGAAIAIIVVLVGAITAGVVLAIGPSVLVPILLGLIAIAVAILSCFAILAVRKALAVVLVVISPVAFVCYMLPNTKSLFRRWLKAFEGVIIAFPVCSAMVYGGQAVSRLIINGSGSTTIPFMLALSAAIIAVVPMFFIPRVVSRSMSAISATVNSVANRARVGAQNRYRNSNGAQDLMRQSQQMRDRRAAGINFRGNPTLRKRARDNIDNRLAGTRLGRTRLVSGAINARRSRLANAESRYDQYAEDNVKNLAGMISRGEDGKNPEEMYKGFKDAMAKGDINSARAYQDVLTGLGGRGKQLMIQAMEEEEDGVLASNAEMRTKLANNIMSKHAGEYKSSNRQAYDWAKKAQSGEDVKMSESIKTKKLSGGYMAGMDEEALDALEKSLGGKTDANVQSAAYEALHGKGAENLESGQRARLESLAGDYKPKAVEDQEKADAAAQQAQIDSITNAVNSGLAAQRAQEQAELAQKKNEEELKSGAAARGAVINQISGNSGGGNSSGQKYQMKKQPPNQA